nr:MAG TPA: hypothetical protein [Caudoviricetes sp.]
MLQHRCSHSNNQPRIAVSPAFSCTSNKVYMLI